MKYHEIVIKVCAVVITIASRQAKTKPNNRVGTKQSAIANCLRMLIMMGDRWQCYKKLLALSIRRLKLSFQRSRLEMIGCL